MQGGKRHGRLRSPSRLLILRAWPKAGHGRQPRKMRFGKESTCIAPPQRAYRLLVWQTLELKRVRKAADGFDSEQTTAASSYLASCRKRRLSAPRASSGRGRACLARRVAVRVHHCSRPSPPWRGRESGLEPHENWKSSVSRGPSFGLTDRLPGDSAPDRNRPSVRRRQPVQPALPARSKSQSRM
jgi:hypothetical protein